MTSEAPTATRKPRVLVSIQDDDVRRRIEGLLATADLHLEVREPPDDPLAQPPPSSADLLVVRRTPVRPQDVRLVEAYARDAGSPGVVVVRDEGGDADRARLLAAGASGVLETESSNRELRESLEALAEVEVVAASDSRVPAGEPWPRLTDFLSRSPRMRRFIELVRRVVDTDSSLLVTGETGVGKERLAQAIHAEGPRRAGPFVAVNCGALPEQLLESELFGHEAGAFTGAVRRKKGRFEQADGGTIFLDEIGEMPAHLQVKLLTVLQRRLVQRIGGEEPVAIDVRVMAATNRDVAREVAEGRFREDLFYRLNVVALDIPPLRERPEDVPDLAGRCIRHLRDRLGRPAVESISDDALHAMLDYAWPGNVRELVNAVEHAVVLCRGSRITLEDLPARVRGEDSGAPEAPGLGQRRAGRPGEDLTTLPLRQAKRRVAAEFEQRYLETLLRRTSGRVGETAELAGITPRALYDKMKLHGLRKEDFR